MATIDYSAPVDSPFAKLLFNRGSEVDSLGIPPKLFNAPDPYRARIYAKSASLLGLDLGDPRYLGFKVRHLDLCLKNSRFSDRITWRSGLEQINKISSIFDEPEGLIVVHSSTNNATASSVRTGSLHNTILQWQVTVQGIYPNLTSYVNGLPVEVTGDADLFYVSVGDSGYDLKVSITAGNQDPVSLYCKILLPYSDSLVSSWTAIKNNKDILTQVVTRQEYLDAITASTSVEDAIAAFLLSLDEL